MATDILKSCENAVNYAWDGIKQAGAKIQEGYNFVGRKVTVLSDRHLPTPLNQIAKESYRGLPYTALLFLVPAPLALLVAGVATLAVATLYASETISKRTALHLLVGIRNFAVIQVGIQTVKAAISANPFYLTTAHGMISLALMTELSIINLRKSGVRVH